MVSSCPVLSRGKHRGKNARTYGRDYRVIALSEALGITSRATAKAGRWHTPSSVNDKVRQGSGCRPSRCSIQACASSKCSTPAGNDSAWIESAVSERFAIRTIDTPWRTNANAALDKGCVTFIFSTLVAPRISRNTHPAGVSCADEAPSPKNRPSPRPKPHTLNACSAHCATVPMCPINQAAP